MMFLRRLATIIATLSLVVFALPASATGVYCFCDMTGSNFGACDGKQIHKTNVTSGDDAACATACKNATLSGGKTYDDYNAESTPVDWQFQGSCLGPNEDQTSNKAKSEQQTWVSSGAAAAAAGSQLKQQGSVVSLTLPLATTSPQVIIGRVIRALLGLVGSIAFLMFIYGGFRWMVARGNAEQIVKAKQTIIWATLGLVIIFAAYSIVSTLIKNISGT